MIDLCTCPRPEGRTVAIAHAKLSLPYRRLPINIAPDEPFSPDGVAVVNRPEREARRPRALDRRARRNGGLQARGETCERLREAAAEAEVTPVGVVRGGRRVFGTRASSPA
ncbi:MAG: hypothetical protein ACLFU0_03860, partial [Alphaproteobacteria bacterium]